MGNSSSCLCKCNADKDIGESSEQLLQRGQLHLLYSKKNSNSNIKNFPVRYQEHHVHRPTRLIVREDKHDGTFHIHAMRQCVALAEQRPTTPKTVVQRVANDDDDMKLGPTSAISPAVDVSNPAQLFSSSYMTSITPRMSGMLYIAILCMYAVVVVVVVHTRYLCIVSTYI